MAHFAHIDENGIVQSVLVIEQEEVDTGNWGEPETLIQTSYNTYGGVHNKGGTPLRKNFAGIGFTYDSVRDAFYAPQPFPSWVLNEDSCVWEAPVAYPDADSDERYDWNEETTSWEVCSY